MMIGPESSAAEPPPRTPALSAETLEYVEDMLLELAHMASSAREPTLATSLAVLAIQCRTRIQAARGAPSKVAGSG